MRLETLARIVAALNGAGVRYLVVGGVAVTVHGFPRLTVDLDLAVALEEENLRRAIDALASLGYGPVQPGSPADFVDPRIRDAWVREKGMQVLTLVSDRTPEIPIGIFAALPFDFERAWPAALRVPLPEGILMPVVDRETLVAMKEWAGRARDLEDVAALRRQEGSDG